MELDEDDEVNEGHADKVQKVGSRSGMDQCSADESVRAIQRQFAMMRSPQKGEARSSSACPPGGVLADEARPSSQNLLQLMGPDPNTQSGAASPYITASAPRRIGFGTPRPSSQLANSGLGRESSSLVSLRTSGPGLLTLGNTFKQLTGEQFKLIKSQQRSSNGLWKSSFAFPGQEGAQGVGRNVFDRDCLIRANEFVCLNIHKCEKGDCLHQVETVDISSARQRLAMIVEEASRSSTNAGKTREIIMREHLTTELHRFYDRTTRCFYPISVSLSVFTTVQMCAASYLLYCGCSSSMGLRILHDVRDDPKFQLQEFGSASVLNGPQSKVDELARHTNDFIMVREYVNQLKSAHEMSPAPGAARKEETSVAKESWKKRFTAMTDYFTRTDAAHVPGNIAMLKRAWKLVDGLIELKQMTHAKCSFCATADAKLWSLRGLTTEEAVRTREFTERAMKEHTAIHLGARRIMDNHAFLSFTSPRSVWTILVDAATCRNFILPKFAFRTPKSFGTFTWRRPISTRNSRTPAPSTASLRHFTTEAARRTTLW